MMRQPSDSPVSRVIYLVSLAVLFMCLTLFLAKWGPFLLTSSSAGVVSVIALAHLPGLTTVMAAGWMVGRRRDPSPIWQVWTAVVALWSVLVTLFVEVM